VNPIDEPPTYPLTAAQDTVPLPGVVLDLEDPSQSDPDEEPLEKPRVSFFELPLLDHLRSQPCHLVEMSGLFDLKALLTDHGAKLFRSEASLSKKAKPILDRLVFELEEGVFGFYQRPCLKVYAPTPEKAVEVALQFRRYLRLPARKQPGFHLLSLDGCYAETEFIPVNRLVTFTNEALNLHYGEDFSAWQQDWIAALTERHSGVSVLFGPPGCGKTTYLRALMGRLIERCVFYYLPIFEFEVLSSPRFVGFWVKESKRHAEKQKIAILEDAEELLLPRDVASRDGVSNLLNIGDGFLGDHLKLRVIATTNVPIQNLDPAIIRPGRLMGSREFPRLDRDAALRVAQAKGIALLRDQPDYSLAEIYCRAPLAAKLRKTYCLGFAYGRDPPALVNPTQFPSAIFS